jgi:hypothetical protein
MEFYHTLKVGFGTAGLFNDNWGLHGLPVKFNLPLQFICSHFIPVSHAAQTLWSPSWFYMCVVPL